MRFIAMYLIESAALVVFAPRSDPSTDQASVQAAHSSDGSQCAAVHQRAIPLVDFNFGKCGIHFFCLIASCTQAGTIIAL
jgi:hypothetical protein